MPRYRHRPPWDWSQLHTKKNRKILNHANDVAERATHLSLESSAVVSVSGGGSYALACSATHSPAQPKRSRLCGRSWFRGHRPEREHVGNRLLFWLAEHTPWLTAMIASRAAKRMVDPKTTSKSLMRLERIQLRSQSVLDRGAAMDHEAVNDHVNLSMMLKVNAKQFWRHGGEAFTEEGRLLVKDPGASLVSVRVPTSLWNGKFDTDVPAAMGGRIAKQFPASAITRVEEVAEKHISLVLK